jgi:catechol 2,3-dioxygenase-like lactoylglutathione lyase family enzyme
MEVALEKQEVANAGNDNAALQAIRRERRLKNPIRRLHHHATRTDDMEATRRFYEDMLGLPLVSTLKEEIDPTTGKATPYLHCFFEMGDGSCIAFFAFAPGGRGKAPLTPQDAFDHHIAISINNFDELKRIRDRLIANNYPVAGIDHGFCYSMYVRDPNQMLVELVADPENELEMNEAFAAEAHSELERWNRGDYTVNNLDRGTMDYPLGSSTVPEIDLVLPADRP